MTKRTLIATLHARQAALSLARGSPRAAERGDGEDVLNGLFRGGPAHMKRVLTHAYAEAAEDFAATSKKVRAAR